jgi:hypothetical protein
MQKRATAQHENENIYGVQIIITRNSKQSFLYYITGYITTQTLWTFTIKLAK